MPNELAPTRPGRRIDALDALRGFALCGIIFINIPQTLDMLPDLSYAPEGLRVFVLGRFYPIFFLLFGIGFGLFLRSAARRTDRPRILLVRRLVALAVLGAAHHLLQPGEVLLPFAITGLLVLLPLSFATARASLITGLILTAAGLLAGVGGLALLPGLFAVGYAMAVLDVIERLTSRAGVLGGAVAVFTLIAVASYWLVVDVVPAVVAQRLGLVFSLTMSLGYAALFLLLLRTPAAALLSGLFAPLGRLALTNYLTATVLFVTFGALLGLRGSDDWGTAALLGAAILVVQAAWSPLWLRRFRYGPLEWVWRCVTYWRRLPLRSAVPARDDEASTRPGARVA
ncbi:putative membrane protein YeiB [Actinoalloteichus hoggarensis]|nr:DUF418 domain-containing protein [Actinoalloteichus hoggarensis]MBB5923931.1 putative membrane protein YeiB [Actinoalloteichus hoggarensis]